MSQTKTNILFPVARFVAGDLYKPNTKDGDGNELRIKNGPNAGQPRVDYFLLIAIPKDGRPWNHTEWGQVLYQAGVQAFPQMHGMPTFAWKIKDGDDAQPRFRNGKPTKPYNQREGWAGHWLVGISSGFAPRIVTADGKAEITEPGAVKLGYYVQVYGNVSGNGSTSKPGIHINHSGIALAGYGPEISTGVDLASVGFGGALPPGASATPLAGMTAVPQQPTGVPGAVPGAPGAPAVGFPQGYPQQAAPVAPAGFPGAPGAAVGAYPPAGVPVAMPQPAGVPVAVAPTGVPQIAGVVPNPAFLSVPGTPAAPVAPVAPVAPPVAPVRQMTAAANGATYEQLISIGWTDQTLVAHGLMLA